MNIDKFASNILRKEREQTIAGKWTVKKLIIDGDFSGTINGLNFTDDVLHTGNWETAEVTGRKKIHTLNTTDVTVRYINRIDVADWLENAVMLSAQNEQIIDGRVQLGSSVFYNDVQVTGDVNGLTINPETVLTKSGEGQVLNGDLTIRTMTPHGMKQLFIENLLLSDGINGRNITEIYENVLKSTDTKINSKRLVFEQPLLVESLETGKSFYGVNMAQFLQETVESNKIVKFHSNLEYLTRVGDNLKASAFDVAVELNHFEYHQSLQGVNIQKTVPFTIMTASSTDYVIAVQERNTNTSFEIIKFYKWSRSENSFVDDGSMLPLAYNIDAYEITKFDKVVFKRIDHLFVEVFDRTSSQFLQQLMLLDIPSRRFVAVITDQKPVSAQYFTVETRNNDCYGAIFPSSKNLNIICATSPSTVLETDPIRMVSSQNDIIILLTDDHQLQIWHRQKIQQVLKVMNPKSFASTRHNEKFYLAVTSDKVEQSIHHGSIEVLESSVSDINFIHVQSFDLDNPFMVQFSVIPSGDLLLYILTKNPGKALSVYKYAGASYFIESIESSTIINTGSHLTTINIDGHTELIAIVSNEVFIIEAVLKEY